jgi:DNA modification methylase
MKVVHGDNIEVLKTYPDNYFDSIVTDPPYGLGKEPNPNELLKDWIEKGYHEIQGKGFMGKEWDAFVPQPNFWKEVFRVLKPGGHVLAFYGTRTYDWGVMAMRFAGFEVRDCIQWLYGSGFPKSHNISKAIDKLKGVQSIKGELKFKGGTQLGVINDDSWKPKDVYEEFANSEDAKNWEGWGSALKPANEPIVLARKPLEKGLSIAENVLKWGTGGINIDGCRVRTNEIIEVGRKNRNSPQFSGTYNNGLIYEGHNANDGIIQGRFPANLILTHHPECECKGFKKVKGSSCQIDDIGKGKNESYNNGIYSDKKGIITISHNDENGEETVEDWNCHPDCPIKILDEQSGISKSNDSKRNRQTLGSFGMPNDETPEYNDKGGASRFFYVAKASKSERNKGLEGFDTKQTIGGGGTYNEEAGAKYGSIKAEGKNFHPTVKPVKLMQYLARLITPANGIVLDPFCGSGTTGIACKLEKFSFVGIEQDAEYTKIAEARIKNTEIDNQQSLFV